MSIAVHTGSRPNRQPGGCSNSNYTYNPICKDNEWKELGVYSFPPGVFSIYFAGKEVAATGTPHLQGFVQIPIAVGSNSVLNGFVRPTLLEKSSSICGEWISRRTVESPNSIVGCGSVTILYPTSSVINKNLYTPVIPNAARKATATFNPRTFSTVYRNHESS